MPAVVTWKVYPYARLGSVDDLLQDYFRDGAKTLNKLQAGTEQDIRT